MPATVLSCALPRRPRISTSQSPGVVIRLDAGQSIPQFRPAEYAPGVSLHTNARVRRSARSPDLPCTILACKGSFPRQHGSHGPPRDITGQVICLFPSPGRQPQPTKYAAHPSAYHPAFNCIQPVSLPTSPEDNRQERVATQIMQCSD